jgi:hypothetical protein
MKKILAKDLKLKFVEVLSKNTSFKYEDGNPFLISIDNNSYFVFLKNLSPAYFKNSPDVTRIQLPFSQHFKYISGQEKPFIILGFDVDNDVFVGWNPDLIKSRLNYKQNVSLYSRNSYQSNVVDNEFFSGLLSNGEKIILFKRNLLIDYFENNKNLFTEKKQIRTKKVKLDNIADNNKLESITDTLIINKIQPLLLKNKLLESIEICNNYYKVNYPDMTFRDWFKIVNKLYNQIIN